MTRLSRALLPVMPFDRRSRKPIYRQLYEGFREAILNRQLKPGQILPSTRALAIDFNVSRISVLGAFEQLLAEGYVETRAGSGTFVANILPEDALVTGKRVVAGSPDQPHGKKQRPGFERLIKPWNPEPWDMHLGAFKISMPSVNNFPAPLWSKIVARYAGKSLPDLFSYGNPLGYQPFREAIAEYLRTARGVRCEPDQIMVVNGSQQALQIATRVLLDPGSSVWMEEPGYVGARAAFHLAGARIIPVAVDEEGLNVEKGIALCPAARAVFVTPSHHYPLGVTMSAARRMQLLYWAARSGAWIIEDDYDSEYRYSSRPVASLQGMDHDSRIILLGTFSKIMFPALRLGYMVIPKDLVGMFAAAREIIDWASPLLYQAVMTEFINEGHFGQHIRRMRMLYRERRDALVETIQSEAQDSLEVLNTDAGMHTVVLLPKGCSDVATARKAAQLGISATPLSFSYLKPPSRGGLILGYGNVKTDEIPGSVHKLNLAVKSSSQRR